MPHQAAVEEQAFFNELDIKLWNAADRLRSNLDAAGYKHAALGLIFLEYLNLWKLQEGQTAPSSGTKF